MIKKILIVLTIFLVIGLIGTIESRYTRDGRVIEITNQEVTVEDKIGCLWTFYGEGYEIDQEITMVMSDNNTSNIMDDKIVRVKP
jgi:hypothetical protein